MKLLVEILRITAICYMLGLLATGILMLGMVINL